MTDLKIEDCEMEDEEINRLRKIEPSAKKSRGRNISMVLYDRSIRGPTGIGGLPRLSGGLPESMTHAIRASPSSVIPCGPTNADDAMDSFKIRDEETNEESNNKKPFKLGGKEPLKGLGNISTRLPNEDQPCRANPPPSPSPPSPITGKFQFNAFPTNHTNEIRNYGEQYSVTKFNWEYLRLRPKLDSSPNSNQPPRIQRQKQREETNTGAAISTISIAFSPDGRTMASTHGDHSVKITCCHTGALVRRLDGHPRTPWTVKYHPIRSNIVASGCLGCQVRVWDWNYRKSQLVPTRNADGTEENADDQYNYHLRGVVLLNMIRLNCAIISLSFHPTGLILAVASGQTLHLWNYDAGQQEENNNSPTRRQHKQTQQNGQQHQQQSHQQQQYQQQNHYHQQRNQYQQQQQHQQQQPSRMGRRTEIRYEHNLRCVRFPPGGKTIIVGGANPPLPATMSPGGDASYSLKLWDFDLEAALNPHLYLGQDHLLQRQDPKFPRRPPTVRRDSLSNSRTFLHRALLYNDGGFDVSPDGKMLCGCAEIFLRQGVKNAMEDVRPQEEHNKARRAGSFPNRVTDTNTTVKEDNHGEDDYLSDARAESLREAVPSMEEEDTSTSGHAVSTPGGNTSLNTSPTHEGETLEECLTPPTNMQTQILTTPPSPPGRRWSLQLKRSDNGSNRRIQIPNQSQRQPPPLPLPQVRYADAGSLNIDSGNTFPRGKFVPHVVVVGIDEKDGSLGRLIEATPLGSKASSVTCVKFSPSAEFCLLGYGVRENAPQPVVEHNYHPVSAVYRVRGGMEHIVTMRSGEDDVNIARFHPHSGHGFVYGTKQGRVRVLSSLPWNYYYD